MKIQTTHKTDHGISADFHRSAVKQPFKPPSKKANKNGQPQCRYKILLD